MIWLVFLIRLAFLILMTWLTSKAVGNQDWPQAIFWLLLVIGSDVSEKLQTLVTNSRRSS